MIASIARRISGGNSSSGLWLKSRIERLDFGSFQRCVWLWLGASGYRHMLFCGRRTQRGRSASGPDFIVRVGENGVNLAVQIRQWKSPVSKRAVDELRGVLLREDIPAGMIVATSQCSRAAKYAATEFGGRPVRIISIDRFCESLQALGLAHDRFFSMVEQFILGSPAATTMAQRLSDSSEKPFEVEFGNPQPVNWPLLIALGLVVGFALVWQVVR